MPTVQYLPRHVIREYPSLLYLNVGQLQKSLDLKFEEKVVQA